MIKLLLKSLAYAVTAGIVLGFGMKIGRDQDHPGSTGLRDHNPEPTDLPTPDPIDLGLLDRLARLENRLSQAEGARLAISVQGRAGGDDGAAKLTTLECQLELRSAEVQQLRDHIQLIEDNNIKKLNALTHTVNEIHEHLTGLIEKTVLSTVERISITLQKSIQDKVGHTANSVAETIYDSVAKRIAVFNTELAVHSNAMNQFREDSLQTQKVLQSVLRTIELPTQRPTPCRPATPNSTLQTEQSLAK